MIIIYLLGKKGLSVLRTVIDKDYADLIKTVVVGKDDNVENDYSDDIIELCNSFGINHCTRDNFEPSQKDIRQLIAIAIGWRWIIKDKYQKTVVFHDSLLPKYRGYNPLVTALLNRDQHIGVTALLASDEVDCGDIISQSSIEIEYPLRIGEAIDKISVLYCELAENILSMIREKDPIVGEPQEVDLATFSIWRDEEDYKIDWSNPAKDIKHFIDCVSFPYSGASATINGSLVRILNAKVKPDLCIANRNVGKVIYIEDQCPVVICGTGLLKLTDVVDEDGKSILPINKFRVRFK